MYGHLKQYREYVWKYNETYRICMVIYMVISRDILHVHINTKNYREYVWKYTEIWRICMEM